MSSLGKLLREAFTCLESFSHEAWRDVNPQEQSSFEKSMLKPNFLLGDILKREIEIGSTLTNMSQTTRT